MFTLDKQVATAGVTDETIEVTALAKYTNYTIQVIGYTKFLGVQSEIVRIITDEDSKSIFLYFYFAPSPVKISISTAQRLPNYILSLDYFNFTTIVILLS